MDTCGVRTSTTKHTARFVCTTDQDGNQIASFYPGAMGEDGTSTSPTLAARADGVDLVLIGADDPAAMLRHTAELPRGGYPVRGRPVAAAAPGSTATRCARLIEGAAYLFCNEYERALSSRRPAGPARTILGRVGIRIITLGAEGARVERRGE